MIHWQLLLSTYKSDFIKENNEKNKIIEDFFKYY